MKGPNPSGLCLCGCGGSAPLAKQSESRRGNVRGLPIRFIQGHQHKTEPAYTVDSDTGCWNWHSVSVHGYGQVRIEGRKRPAHRVMYEKLNGAIPDGMVLDHLCRNRRCVNPEHLEAVSSGENTRRSPIRTKLKQADIRRVQELSAMGMKQSDIAREVGVSQKHISRILRGEGSAHVYGVKK